MRLRHAAVPIEAKLFGGRDNETLHSTDEGGVSPDIRAMAHQDIAVARERLSEGKAMLRDYLVREPVKALGITLCIGVALGWLIRRR